jgi:hypothetical protein
MLGEEKPVMRVHPSGTPTCCRPMSMAGGLAVGHDAPQRRRERGEARSTRSYGNRQVRACPVKGYWSQRIIAATCTSARKFAARFS